MERRAVGVFGSIDKRDVKSVALFVVEFFRMNAIDVYMHRELADALSLDDRYVTADFHECGCLFTLGGDGTILTALDAALESDIPILGINLGRVGFLTEVSPEELRGAASRFLTGDYTVEERMLLEINGDDGQIFYALNEVAFNRTNSMVGILTLEAYHSGVLVDRYAGDGLIVATATGSTAYSLSAGGPIVAPGADLLLLTPICAHTLTSRPVILPTEEPVRVRVTGDSENAMMMIDGRRAVELNEKSGMIRVSKSEKRARFIRFGAHNYFDLLRQKLSDWTH